MCLVVFALDVSADVSWVVAANRDEYFARPSAPAAWWHHDGVALFGGRDLDKGGTWLAVTRGGRIAIVTNVRDLRAPAREGSASRGFLVRDALTAADLPPVVAREQFPAFNLIVGDGDAFFYVRDDQDTVRVSSGLHGLSNHRLDTPWPKVERARDALAAMGEHPDSNAIFHVLADYAPAADRELPSTGVPIDVERALSSPCVRMPEIGYGTRCSTVVIRRASGVIDFEERTFDETGAVRATTNAKLG